MTTYTDVFGNSAVPPSEYGYQSITITSDASTQWPYNYSGTGTVISKIMDVTCGSGNSITLPPANQVSTGEDFLFRNVGSNTLTVKKYDGTTLGTVSAGTATYFYVTDNTTTAGVYGQIAYGAGSASISAGALVGYGLQAAGSLLNVAFSVSTTGSLSTVTASNQASLINYTGGSGTLALTAAATLGNAFWLMYANNGTGTVTIDPNAAETIDGQSSKTLNPGESLMLFCSGTAWYTVGYGRSTTYQFTQLVLDVTSGGTFTLSSAQAANKLLTFIGTPGAGVTVVVPNVVSVYYTQNSLSTAFAVTLKTAAGTGVAIAQSQRVVAICDATNVVAAQSASVSSTVSLLDGSAAAPSLNFASQTNTGMYKYGTYGVGFSNNGVDVFHTDVATGTAFSQNVTFSGTSPIISAKAGPASGQQHTIPAVTSDTFTLNAATQTLSNKTFVAPVLGTPASGTLTNCSGLPANGYVTMIGDSGSGGTKGAVPAPAAGDAAANKYLKADGTWTAVSSSSSGITVGSGSTNPTAAGTAAVGVGNLASAGSNYSTAIGSNSSGTGSQCVTGAGAVSIGGAYSSGADSFAASLSSNSSSYGAKATSAVAIGSLNLASGNYSTVFGRNATAAGVDSVAIGKSAYAQNTASFAFGDSCITFGIGKFGYASGALSFGGDAQYGILVCRAAPSSGSSGVITSDGNTASAFNQLAVASGQAMTVTGMIVGKVTGSASVYSATFTAQVINNGGTVTLGGAVTLANVIDNIGLTTAPTVTADNTNKALQVTSGAKTATTIKWVCTLQSAEITY